METTIANLQTTVIDYIGTASTFVVAVGIALVGLTFVMSLLRKGRSAAAGRV